MSLISLLSASACLSPQPMIGAQVVEGTSLEALDDFYVHTHKEDRGIGEMIARDLEGRGKRVRWGEDPALPDGTQVLVRYDDSWMWDLTMYLLLLRIDFRDPGTNLLLAAGSSSRPSAMRSSPEQMVQESMDAIFQGGMIAFPDLVLEEE